MPPAPSPSRPAATALGGVAILLWSANVGLSRSVCEQVGLLTAGAIVFTGGGLLGVAYLAARGRLGTALRAPRSYLLGCGALFVAYVAAIYLGVGLARSRQQAIEVGILNYLWPALTLVLAIPILGARVRPVFWLGVAFGLAGAALAPLRFGEYSGAALREHLSTRPVPYLFGLLAAVLWGLYSNVGRRTAGAAAGAGVPLFILASGLALAAARAFVPETSAFTARAVSELSLLALLPTLVAYALWDVAVRQGDFTTVGALSYATPVLATAFAAAWLGVAPGLNVWVACALVVAGAVVCRRGTAGAEEEGVE